MSTFNILVIGDIFGRPGREVLEKTLPKIISKYDPVLTIVNGENAAHGFGISEKIARQFFEWEVDVITTGNHIWDRREIGGYIDEEPRLIRPLNYPDHQPGNGFIDIDCTEKIIEKSGTKEAINNGIIRIINLAGRIGMRDAENPFRKADSVVGSSSPNDQGFAGIVVDFHAEATSEKTSMLAYLSGRVSALLGTHTHIPTADARIVQGTGYMTDLGMTGVYDSSIGIDKYMSVDRFLEKVPPAKMEPAEGPATVCGVCLSLRVKDGLCDKISPLRIGPWVEESNS